MRIILCCINSADNYFFFEHFQALKYVSIFLSFNCRGQIVYRVTVCDGIAFFSTFVKIQQIIAIAISYAVKYTACTILHSRTNCELNATLNAFEAFVCLLLILKHYIYYTIYSMHTYNFFQINFVSYQFCQQFCFILYTFMNGPLCILSMCIDNVVHERRHNSTKIS